MGFRIVSRRSGQICSLCVIPGYKPERLDALQQETPCERDGKTFFVAAPDPAVIL